jgi:hypothetical protein
MPGIWDKFKKFGQNLWNGISNGWNAVKTVTPAVTPLLGPQGQQIANTISKGIDMGRRVESTLGNMRTSQSTARRRASIVHCISKLVKRSNVISKLFIKFKLV